MKDISIFLHHILESIEAIESYTDGLSEEEFLSMPEKQDAVMRRLEIIGEAVRNIPEEFRTEYPDIEWNKAMGTRNILVHHYFGIDLKIVWDTLLTSLPQFKMKILELLDKS